MSGGLGGGGLGGSWLGGRGTLGTKFSGYEFFAMDMRSMAMARMNRFINLYLRVSMFSVYVEKKKISLGIFVFIISKCVHIVAGWIGKVFVVVRID